MNVILTHTQLVRKYIAFYGTHGTLPCSQKSDNGPCPEPDNFILLLQTLSL